ncbi:MAG: tRNA pseudouridine(38-40) synthase TruA [Actinomycetota bacterium]
MTRRWRLDVAYDGSAFHGFASQPGLVTVAGALEVALQRLCRLEGLPRLVCAGRTDAGVHALAQVVHVDLPEHLPPSRNGEALDERLMLRGLNHKLPASVKVTAVSRVADSFDARRSATERAYRYLVDEGLAPDPLLRHMAWHVDGPLDVAAMNEASKLLLGSHDFRSFCRRVPGTSPDEEIVRKVLSAAWSVQDRESAHPGSARLLRFDIHANAFCHTMVRSLVGQLVAIGAGRSGNDELELLLSISDRHRAADPAPGHGLCLIGVTYGVGILDGVPIPMDLDEDDGE